jgi:hypothetical protein
MAANSADRAIALYMGRQNELGGTIARLSCLDYLSTALDVAVDIHAFQDRWDIAFQAAALAVRCARFHARTGAPPHARKLVRTLVKQPLWLQRSGRVQESEPVLAEARGLDPAVANDAERSWWKNRTNRERHYKSTTAAALDEATKHVGIARIAALTSRAHGAGVYSMVSIPSMRCPPEVAHVWATEWAHLTLDLMVRAPAAAIRLGLEAHYLFASASRAQTLALRYTLSETGKPCAASSWRVRGGLRSPAKPS